MGNGHEEVTANLIRLQVLKNWIILELVGLIIFWYVLEEFSFNFRTLLVL